MVILGGHSVKPTVNVNPVATFELFRGFRRVTGPKCAETAHLPLADTRLLEKRGFGRPHNLQLGVHSVKPTEKVNPVANDELFRGLRRVPWAKCGEIVHFRVVLTRLHKVR